jgi:hypothetical protein
MAVVNGTLLGEQTTLVVQEFGSPIGAAPLPKTPTTPVKVASNPEPVVNIPQTAGVSAAEQTGTKPLVDPFMITRTVGLTILFVAMILIAIDWMIMRRRAVYRIASRHLPHLMVLALAIGFLLSIGPGVIN